jgi:hypothetical protein
MLEVLAPMGVHHRPTEMCEDFSKLLFASKSFDATNPSGSCGRAWAILAIFDVS